MSVRKMTSSAALDDRVLNVFPAGSGMGPQLLYNVPGLRIAVTAEAVGGAGANEVRITCQVTQLDRSKDVDDGYYAIEVWNATTIGGGVSAQDEFQVVTGTLVTSHTLEGHILALTNSAGLLVMDVRDDTANATTYLHLNVGGVVAIVRMVWGTG